MRTLRVVWAVTAVLGFFGAWFAPVVSLPLLAVAAVAALRLSRRMIVHGEGRVRPRAAWPALALLGLVAAAALVPWDRVLPAQGALGPESPNPQSVSWWALTPAEHLVWADPFYAGVIGPVLLVAAPCALAIALAVALGRDGR